MNIHHQVAIFASATRIDEHIPEAYMINKWCTTYLYNAECPHNNGIHFAGAGALINH